MRKTFLILLFVIAGVHGSQCLGSSFVVIPPSVRAWGMGGAGGALADPYSAFFNPGGLGVYALDGSAGLIYNSSDWLPAFDLGIEYKNYLAFAGAPILKRRGPKAPRVALALAFHRKTFSYSETIRTDEFGNSMAFKANERSNNFTVALGLEHGIEMGVGLTISSVKSVLADQGAGAEIGSGEGTGTGRDIGVFVRLPIVAAVRKFGSADGSYQMGQVRPEFIVAVAQAWQNRGGEVSYPEAYQIDPSPKLDRLSVMAQLRLDYEELPLLLLTFTSENEKRKDTDTETDRQGWEVDMLGIISVRGGWFDPEGSPKIHTDGLSFHSGGLTRWVGQVAYANNGSAVPWYLRQVDVYYATAGVDDDKVSLYGGTELDEFGVIVKLNPAGIL